MALVEDVKVVLLGSCIALSKCSCSTRSMKKRVSREIEFFFHLHKDDDCRLKTFCIFLQNLIRFGTGCVSPFLPSLKKIGAT